MNKTDVVKYIKKNFNIIDGIENFDLNNLVILAYTDFIKLIDKEIKFNINHNEIIYLFELFDIKIFKSIIIHTIKRTYFNVIIFNKNSKYYLNHKKLIEKFNLLNHRYLFEI